MLTADEEAAETIYPTKRGIVPVGGRIAGPAHDRALCATTALVAAVALSRHLATGGADPLSAWALGGYVGAGIVGYGVGKAIPAEYRGALQAACTAALTLVGVGTIGL